MSGLFGSWRVEGKFLFLYKFHKMVDSPKLGRGSIVSYPKQRWHVSTIADCNEEFDSFFFDV